MSQSKPPRGTPSPRGRLMFPEDIRTEIFNDRRTAWWVRRNVAPTKKLRLGHSTVAWYEHDVYEWLDCQREG
jgi:hypothetical protein